MRSGLAALLVVLLGGCVRIGVPPGVGGPVETPASSAPLPASPPPSVASGSALPTPAMTPASSDPSPSPDPGAMSLEVTSCNGGTVLRWTPSHHPDFHHYIGLRSPEEEIADQYPPIAPAVDWGDLWASDRFVTSGYDATVVPSDTEWHYLVVAYDERGRAVSRTNVASGRILPHRNLGALEAEVLEDGAVRLRWGRFTGRTECFSAYRILHGTGGVAGTLLTSVSDPEVTELETTQLRPGVTYTLRVQAVQTTTLGRFTLGESDPLTISVPAAP